MNWTPIRKVVAAAVASALTWVALRVGLDLGPDAINEAAAAIVGIAFAYLVRDPRVS